MPSLLISLALPLALGSAAPALPPGTVARIGAYTLPAEVFEAYWQALPQGRRQDYEKSGGKGRFLQDLVDQKLIVAEAERTGQLDRPEVRVMAELARDVVLYRALVQQEVTDKTVTEAAILARYEAEKARFEVAETARVRQILVTPWKEGKLSNQSGDDATSEADARAKIERIAAEIKQGGDFVALAQRWSEDLTAPRGGLLDEFPRGRMAKPIEDAAFSLAPGTVSDILRTSYGFHILRVEGRTPAHPAPLDEVRPALARELAEERRAELDAALRALTARLRQQTTVVLDPALAAPAVPPRSAAEPAP